MAGVWVLAILLAAQAADGAAIHARLDALVVGRGYTTEQLNSRWANSAAAARDPDARSLFWRVYAEQNALHADDIPSAEKQALLRRNSDWLKSVLARIGWFDISRYGAEASQAAWLIVQHSDHDPAWQQQVLADLAPRVARGDMQRNYYAYLIDRVAVGAGRPQTYGTQGRCDGSGNLQLFEVEDRANIDRRRSEMGMESIAAYTVRFCGAAPPR
jgi:hypothetical protein